MHTFTTRMLRTTAVVALAAISLALAPGCAITPRPHAIHARGAHDGLACTPLALTLIADDARVSGSGVLVHPRVLLTASHVLRVEPKTWVVSAGHHHERVRIQRVIDGGGSVRSGDWALLVLEKPLETMSAIPATLPPAPPGLRPGDAVIITGYPGGDIWDRAPLLIASVCRSRPLEAPDEPEVVYVRGSRGGPDHGGVSGGPVLAPDDAGPCVVVGLYTGTATRRFIGLPLAEEMVIHTLPLDQIRRVIAEVEAEEQGIESRGAEEPASAAPGPATSRPPSENRPVAPPPLALPAR